MLKKNTSIKLVVVVVLEMSKKMKKLNPDKLLLQEEELLTEIDAQELAQIIPIRTETALTRFPFHRLAKKGSVLIKEEKKNPRGKVITMWEVKHPPGPLAYKIDTLIINRRIDEMRNTGNIKQLFKLGSLRDICGELGFTPNGTNMNGVKKALEENAFAGIKANLSYKGNDGTERDFEFITTRYTVIFTGEKLPNEKRADAVYIELHPRYHEMLKHSKTRPLDYKYLRELAPAPQRFYELLSFAMFGTLMHGRPNAQMLYSEFCRSAPLTRYTERTKTTKQMYKIHKPHIDAGYIKSVEFLETIDENGVIDWLMKYIPGRRARHEFRAFSNKRLTEQQSRKPRLVKPQKKKDKAPSVALQHKHQENPLLEKLMSFGIGESRAVKLINSDSAECELWVGAWSFQNQKGMDNPAAVLIKFIETKHRPFPKAYKDSKARESRQREQEEQVTRQQAEDFYFDFYSESFRAFQRIEFQAIRENNLEAFTVFEKWLDKNHGRGLRMLDGEATREKITLQRADEFFTAIQPELGVKMTSFQEWDEKYNTKRSDPVQWYAKNLKEVEKMYRS